jgi:hypothetical protein
MNKVISLITKEKEEKIKKQRQVIETENWTIEDEDFIPENQVIILQNNENNKTYNKMIQQINRKISGYKSQDKEKNLYDANNFIILDKILYLLKECECKCFYCNNLVYILYKHVREPKQWTLERIDNKYGHNNENVKIACLDCNIKRRTMYHERFSFTKQLKIIKKDI